MKKILFAMAVLAGTALGSFAQTSTTSPAKGGVKFSIGVEGGLPIGDITQVYSAVIGGSLKLEIPISSTAYFTINGGYNSFLVKNDIKALDPESPSSTGFLPIKAGIKVYTEGSFFIEGQAGTVFVTESGGGNSFAWSAGIGYTFSGHVELGARYEGWTNGGTIGQAGIRLAYRF